MSNIYHLSGLIGNNVNEYDRPDIAGDIKGFSDSLYSDLKRITQDDTDFDYHTRQMDSTAGDMKDYANSTELDNFLDYVTNLESLVMELTNSSLMTSRMLQRASDELMSIDNTWNRETIRDKMLEASERVEECLGGSGSLHNTLSARGWHEETIHQLKSIMYWTHPYVELLAFVSEAHRMLVGVRGKMEIDNQYVKLFDGMGNTLVFSQMFGKLYIQHTAANGNLSTFKLHEMKDIFMDLFKPTDDEIAAYEMVSGFRYDIYLWRDIFNPFK